MFFVSLPRAASIKTTVLCTALPTMGAMTVTALCTLFDSVFAAAYAPDSAAVVGYLAPLLALVQAVGYTAALGGGTVISRCLGAGRRLQAEQTATLTLLFSPLMGCLAGIGAFLGVPYVLPLLGVPASLQSDALAYGRLLGISAPLIGLQYALHCILRSTGHALSGFFGVALGGGVQLIGAPLFLRLFGVAGVGLALLLGQSVSTAALFTVYRRWGGHRIKGKIKELTTLLRFGSPCFFRQVLAVLCMALLNRKLAAAGNTAVASMTAVWRISGLIYAAFLGWAQGFLPVAGYAAGGGNAKTLQKSFRFSLTAGIAFITVISVAVIAFASPLMMRFTGKAATPFGTAALICQMAVMPLVPLGVLVGMVKQAKGRTAAASLISCCRQGFLLLPAIVFLPIFRGIHGLIIAQPAADALTFLVAVVCLVYNKKPG